MNRFLLVISSAVLCIKLSASANVVGRSLCGPGDKQPSTRKNTTEILETFRKHMSRLRINGTNIAGYIQYTTDPHMTEYHLVADYDKRVEFMTGFKGKGFAFITTTESALFTERSFRQEADNTMDCNWSLLFWSQGDNGSSSISQWFASAVLPERKYVGIDGLLITKAYFEWFESILAALPTPLVLIEDIVNYVDNTWDEFNRPQQPDNPVNALDLKFAGVSWREKIKNLRSNITKKGADAFVVTSLDEIAWLFNLRGSDTKYGPYVHAYAIVEVEPNRTLLILDNSYERLRAQPTDPETKVKLRKHLEPIEWDLFLVDWKHDPIINVFGYDKYGPIRMMSLLKNLTATRKYWITPEANYDIFLGVKNNFTIAPSPIAIDKSVKNPQESAGMRNANIRDSAGLIQFLAFLEKEIKSGQKWTEYSAAVELQKRRSELEYNRGLSFETIAGYGSNGAIMHYRPTNGRDKLISIDSLFVLDSGGNYLDGMTDITRTMHYGQPTDYQKECYTRVLMAKINLAMFKWPKGLKGSQIDIMTLHQLWDVGLNFHHRKGHGIKSYLDVDEGPEIGEPKKGSSLKANEFYAIEPGYYEEGQFGIRLESTFGVVPFLPKFNTSKKSFLQFDPVTFVPFEPNLIEYKLLNQRQVEWLNEYNSNITKYILPLLKGDSVAIDWLTARTKPYNCSSINLAISGKLDMNVKIDL